MKPTPELSPAAAEVLGALTEFRDALRTKVPIKKVFTVRTVELNLHPQEFGAEAVKGTRRLLRLSQALFAQFLGVDVRTLRSWEQGTKKPSPIACRFLAEIIVAPDHWRERLRQMIVTKETDSVSS